MARQVQVLTVEDWNGGIDRRSGALGPTGGLPYWDACNVVPVGRSLRTRPPVAGSATLFSHVPGWLCGPFQVGDRLVCVDTRSSGATKVVPSQVAEVRAITGHAYDGASDRSYVTHAVEGNVLAVVLRAHRSGTGVNWLELHVWDGKADEGTLVIGQGAPWMEPCIANVGTGAAYAPVRLCFAAGRLVLSDQAGNVWRSAAGNYRVWWDLDTEDITEEGYAFLGHGTNSGGAASNEIIVPVDYAQLTAADRYQGLLLERLMPDGSWAALGIAAVSAVANAGSAPTYANWTKVTWVGTTDYTVRCRVFPPRSGAWRGRQYAESLSPLIPLGGTAVTLQTWVVAATGAGQVFVLDQPAHTWDHYAPNVQLLRNGTLLVPGPGPIGQWKFSAREQKLERGATNSYGTQCTVSISLAAGDYIKLLHLPDVQAAAGTATCCVPALDFVAAGQPRRSQEGQSSTALTAGQSVWLVVQEGAGGIWSPTFLSVDGMAGDPLWLQARARAVVLGQVVCSGGGIYSWVAAGANASASWDEAQHVLRALRTGIGDAGRLPVANAMGASSPVTELVGTRDRLLVGTATGRSLWAVGVDSGQDRLLDTSTIGTGTPPRWYATATEPVGRQSALWEGSAYGPLSQGIGRFSIAGDLAQRLEAAAVTECLWGPGENLFAAPDVLAVVPWPHLGCLVVVTRTGTAAAEFWIQKPTRRGSGWYRWQLATGAEVFYPVPESVCALGRRLYFRDCDLAGGSQEGCLRWFEVQDGAFLAQDSDPRGPVTAPYEVSVVPHYLDHARPTDWKQWEAFDMEGQANTLRVSFRLRNSGGLRTGPAVAYPGQTGRRQPIPIGLSDTAIRPEINAVAQGASMWSMELYRLSLIYRVLLRVGI